MKVCSECKVKKAGRHFNRDTAGVLNQQCKKCEASTAGEIVIRVQRKQAEPETAPTPEPVVLRDALEVLPGFGFRASLENDRLAIEQDRDDGTADNVVLSRTEAKVLFAQYLEWAST